MRRLIILSDYGLDDAVALVYLLKNNKWEKIDIVSIAGNVTAIQSFDNVQKLLANYLQVVEDKNQTKVELNRQKLQKEKLTQMITIVDTTDINQPFAQLPSIHGYDGMGDLYIKSTSKCKVQKWDEWMGQLDINAKYTIVSLGPATLVKPLISKLTNPKNSKLLLMGHCINAVPNYEGQEFNYKLDEDAFEWCIANTDCVVATLDTCRDEYFNLAKARVKSNCEIFDKFVNKAIELAVKRHADNCFIYDYIAVRYLIDKKNFEISVDQTKNGNFINHLKTLKK